MNLFGTVLTYPAPSANYRGESEENRTVIQKITQGRHEYAIISPEAMRNAMREMLRAYGLPCNRERLEPRAGKKRSTEGEGEDEKQQLAVKFTDYPDPERFADDFFFGYLLAVKGKEMEKLKEKLENYPLKRDSILRMNLAKALEPYRHDAIFTQSPQIKDSPWEPGGGEGKASSALLHRETTFTAFQYPFAINLNDCGLGDPKHGKTRKKWLLMLLKSISELNGVAGNHARSYFEMAPASIVLRLSGSMVAGYDTYGFQPDGSFPEVTNGILAGDYPGSEFYIGGRIVREVLKPEETAELARKEVKLFRMASAAIDAVARLPQVCGEGLPPQKKEGA